MANSNLITLFFLLIFGYFVLYFGGRKYLESFQSEDDIKNRFNPDGTPRDDLNMTVYPPEKPYLMNPIDDLDDYEISAVFQNQGSKTASRKQISDAMTRYPMDWSVQPPNSQLRLTNVRLISALYQSLNNVNLAARFCLRVGQSRPWAKRVANAQDAPQSFREP